MSKMTKVKAFVLLTMCCALFIFWENQHGLKINRDVTVNEKSTPVGFSITKETDESIRVKPVGKEKKRGRVSFVARSAKSNSTKADIVWERDIPNSLTTESSTSLNIMLGENEIENLADVKDNRKIETQTVIAGKTVYHEQAREVTENERRGSEIDNSILKPLLLQNTTISLDGGWKSWFREQKRRKDAIKNACKALKIPQSDFGQYLFAGDYFKQFLVVDKHKAIYCFIPKVACTNWKKVWMVLTGLTVEKNLTNIPLMTPHLITEDMELMSNIKRYSDIGWKMKTYKKLIIVRHPFQRLLSAFRDKIHVKMGVPYFQRQVWPFVKKQRSDANLTNVQWPEFVDFLNVKGGNKGDNHWRSYEALCHPCTINFDVVARFETLLEDSERFLKLIGAPDDVHFPKSSRTSRRVDDDFWNQYKEMLSSEQLSKLYKAYENDFKIFEYF